MRQDRDAIVDCIRRGQRFLLATHRAPDADSLGSALGLAGVLRACGKQAEVLLAETLADWLHCLPGVATTRRSLGGLAPFDATFVMDLATDKLLPAGFPKSDLSGPIVVVDHHAVHDDFGDLVWRDEAASSTAEVVADLAAVLGVDDFDLDTATCLYAALISDTGGFRYSNTSAKSMRLGATLLEKGVDAWQLAYRLFEDWQKPRFDLLGEALRAMRVELDGRLTLMRIDRAVLERTGASEDMIEGLVNYGRMLRGVEVSALVWQERTAAGAPPRTRVSLRSTHHVDVTRIAIALGGGGHRRAAGATVEKSLDEVIQLIETTTAEVLSSGSP